MAIRKFSLLRTLLFSLQLVLSYIFPAKYKSLQKMDRKRDQMLAQSNEKGYYVCLSKAAKSKGIKEADEMGGKLGVNEYLIETCGTRPVIRIRGGRHALAENDCNEIYNWAMLGDCEAEELANYQSEILKQLNPKIFRFNTYANACRNMERSGSLLEKGNLKNWYVKSQSNLIQNAGSTEITLDFWFDGIYECAIFSWKY